MIPPLYKKYPLIVAWGRRLGSFDYYILQQCERAEAAGAPRNALYELETPGGIRTGQWVTLDDLAPNHSLRPMLEEALKS